MYTTSIVRRRKVQKKAKPKIYRFGVLCGILCAGFVFKGKHPIGAFFGLLCVMSFVPSTQPIIESGFSVVSMFFSAIVTALFHLFNAFGLVPTSKKK